MRSGQHVYQAQEAVFKRKTTYTVFYRRIRCREQQHGEEVAVTRHEAALLPLHEVALLPALHEVALLPTLHEVALLPALHEVALLPALHEVALPLHEVALPLHEGGKHDKIRPSKLACPTSV